MSRLALCFALQCDTLAIDRLLSLLCVLVVVVVLVAVLVHARQSQ